MRISTEKISEPKEETECTRQIEIFKENEVGMACGTYGGEEKCMQDLCGET